MAVIKHTEFVVFTPDDATAKVWDGVPVYATTACNRQHEYPAHPARVATRSTTRNV